MPCISALKAFPSRAKARLRRLWREKRTGLWCSGRKEPSRRMRDGFFGRRKLGCGLPKARGDACRVYRGLRHFKALPVQGRVARAKPETGGLQQPRTLPLETTPQSASLTAPLTQGSLLRRGLRLFGILMVNSCSVSFSYCIPGGSSAFRRLFMKLEAVLW